MIIIDKESCDFDEVTGCLYINWIQEILRIHSWARGCDVEAFRNNLWSPYQCDIPLVNVLPDKDDLDHPIARFLSLIPGAIREHLALYTVDQLPMLQLCARSKRAVQLLYSSPNLLWFILPELMEYLTQTGVDADTVLGNKRRVLLCMAGGRDEPWIVRLLERLGPAPDRNALAGRQSFHILMNTPNALETLRHKKALTWDMIVYAAKNTHLFAEPIMRRIFLDNMDESMMKREHSSCRHLLDDTRRMGLILGIDDSLKLIRACRSYTALETLHDAWTRRVNALQLQREGMALTFPPPPLPGGQDIVPITTMEELLEEGRLMHHCVGSYAGAVRDGISYIYKVLHPERATLEIKKTFQGWRLAQLRCRYNGHPDEHTVQTVNDWFGQYI